MELDKKRKSIGCTLKESTAENGEELADEDLAELKETLKDGCVMKALLRIDCDFVDIDFGSISGPAGCLLHQQLDSCRGLPEKKWQK